MMDKLLYWYCRRYSNVRDNNEYLNFSIPLTAEDEVGINGKSPQDAPQETAIINQIRETVYNCISLLSNSNLMRDCMLDSMYNNYRKVNLLMSFFNCGMAGSIIEVRPVSEMKKNSLSKQLQIQYDMDVSDAEWCVNFWCSVIDDAVAERYQQYTSLHSSDEYQDSSLIGKQDLEDYYINVSLTDSIQGIPIPCGFGETDYGFTINGIVAPDPISTRSEYNVFALTYNFLMRNSNMSGQDIPFFLKSSCSISPYEYGQIFKYAVIVLQMVKRNFGVNGNRVYACADNSRQLSLAVELINHYAKLFSLLTKAEFTPLELVSNTKSLTIDINGREMSLSNIYVSSNSRPCNARMLWFGNKVWYSLSAKDIPLLEELLHDLSPYLSFREGQAEALIKILNEDTNSVCIMPTGSGKSLIYYFMAVLQPLPVMVFSPTEILIKDQISNLRDIHHFDNVCRLTIDPNYKHDSYIPRNSLIFLTPNTFQDRNLLVMARHMNNGEKHEGVRFVKYTDGPSLSYVVLDEVHCISDWGHDFRPEYLMLSKFLRKYLDNIPIVGFTATADYTVANSLREQLGLRQDMLFSPITYDKQNISYRFMQMDSPEEMISSVCSIVHERIEHNERTIIFTKDRQTSYFLAQRIGYNADVFESGSINSYKTFARGKCSVLITDEELGVGINFMNVTNIIHFGLPLSKADFVQEVGRAGRSNEDVNSFVIYLKPSDEYVDPGFLSRLPSTDYTLRRTMDMPGDYSHICKRLTNGLVSKEEVRSWLIRLYMKLESDYHISVLEHFDESNIKEIKRYLYMLYAIGYITDWYTQTVETDIWITRHSSNSRLNQVKDTSLEYFSNMSDTSEQRYLVAQADSIETIIGVYAEWYFESYLYKHKELFLDCFEFIAGSSVHNNTEISEEIKDYYTLDYQDLSKDEKMYYHQSMTSLASMLIKDFSPERRASFERILASKYNEKLDAAVFIANMVKSGGAELDQSRFMRAAEKFSLEEKAEAMSILSDMFMGQNKAVRLKICDTIKLNQTVLGVSFYDWLEQQYRSSKPDDLYWGFWCQRLNTLFK